MRGVFLFALVSSAVLAAPEIVDVQVAAPVTVVSREELEKLPVNRNFSDLLKVCPAQTLPTVRPGQQVRIDGYPAKDQMDCIRPGDLRMIDIFKGHNEARALYGSPPLVWDPMLAAGAADYARQLTTLGRVHASREGRKDIRENLLQSLNGQRSAKDMVGVWTAESQYFKFGVFPDVSTNGDWAKVGHYTQMIWPTTTRLGCAIHSDAKFDWTVCRYSPPGNRDGSTLLAGRLPLIRCKVGFEPAPLGTFTYQIRLDPSRLRISKDGKSIEIADDPAPSPPPESILDDIGDTQPPAAGTGERPCPAPLPPTDTRRVHDTPMPQPQSPATPEPPAPIPTAADPAPAGYEFAHPLYFHFENALELYKKNPVVDMNADMATRELALRQMRYAYEEMRKRYKAAKAAGDMSSVKPENVQKVLKFMEDELRKALRPAKPVR